MTHKLSPDHLTIGVFDSGFGGLTVLRELLQVLPNASFIYLGDTARLPYGAKSQATVARCAVSAASFLVAQGAALLVIACNTATALAINDIRAAVTPIPVIGVIEPGAQAARAANSSGHVLVLATAATVHSGAYTQALAHQQLTATEKACPLLVPLVEEGWIDHSVTAEVIRIYLSEALAAAPQSTTLLLGCTHYPLLKQQFSRTLEELGHPLTLIDSAESTARFTAETISSLAPATTPSAAPKLTVFATDSIEKFRRLGSQFLSQPLPHVQLIDLGE